jgi:Phage derived protein Gp49-like (DUF891)
VDRHARRAAPYAGKRARRHQTRFEGGPGGQESTSTKPQGRESPGDRFHFDGGTNRGVYTIEFEEMVYTLDVFKKKSKEGRATPKQDIDRIVARVKAVRQWRQSPEGKVVVASALADLKRRQAELDEKEQKNALKPKQAS